MHYDTIIVGGGTAGAFWRPVCPRTHTAAYSSWKPDRTSRTQSNCRIC